LNVVASGSPTLTYQWRQDGSNIPNATNTSYAVGSSVVGDSGDYDVIVTNPYGSVTSVVAAVTITPLNPPQITQAPASLSLFAGYPATFSVAATGGLLTYQWKSNSVAIPGATNDSYTIAAISPDDAGTYTVDVNNPVGPIASASATLTVKVPTGNYESVVVGTKPLIWFRANETEVPVVNTGTAANSGSTGSAGDGVAKRYVNFQQDGALAGDANKAAGFISNSQNIDVPYSVALNSNTVFTAEMWVKAPPVNNGFFVPLVNRGPFAGDGWVFFGWNGVSTWQFRCYEGTTRHQVYSTSPIVPGQWTHLVGVYDGTTVRLYVNGVEEASTNGVHIANSSIPLRMAGWPNDNETGGGNFAGGFLDEVAIYNTALAPSVIASHYQNGTNASRTTPYDTLVQTSSPVGYWRLNDPAGPIPPSPKNSGTLGVAFDGSYGGDILPAIVGPRPPENPGLEADNLAAAMTNGYIVAPRCTNLNVNTLTVAGWLSPNDIPSGGDIGWPCWLGDGGMHIENSGGRPTRELRYHWKGNYWGWGSGLVVPSNTWTFVAMVVEPTKATFYMSEGGILKSSVNNATHAPLAVTSALGFGGNQPGRTDRTYRGKQDEFAVYNRALSLSEINTLFLVGTGAKLELSLTPGGIIEDNKPAGTPHNGLNLGTTWVASSTDAASSTRTGVAQFSATGTQITIAPDPDFNSAYGTIMFWMRFNALVNPVPGPGNEAAILFDRRTSSGLVITLADAGDIFVQGTGGAPSIPQSLFVADDVWHHIALTYGQTTNDWVNLYIDGSLYGLVQPTGNWTWPASQQLELGRSHDGYWKRFDGQMDDFRIYNRELNPTEIASAITGALVDTAALKVQYNFNDAGLGWTVGWPFGTLQSSPTLGPSATWTPVPGATGPSYPFMPTEPVKFFRAVP
ncbi:MAG: LamG-like jellyroll fold domain-containing protein, partial [Synechococcaceae cyanobacterium]|nr:LamG-like jellyroll fold domain-containing protein [Synechococcaceae cyanobacterium]